jgi:hypothetical protein
MGDAVRQMKGRPKSTSLVFFGEKMTIAEAIRRFGGEGVTYATFKKRYYDRMWGHERAVTEPNVGPGGGKAGVMQAKGWRFGQAVRNEILRRYCAGERPCDIARDLKINSSYPSALARRYGKPMHRGQNRHA